MNGSRLFKFKPERELLVVFASWILVTLTFFISFRIITTQRVAAQFITFGILGIALFGVLLPIVWNTLVMKRQLSAIGITKEKLLVSLLGGFILSVVQYFLTLRTIPLPGAVELIPLVTMALAVGLYENIFYRGWIQKRMEQSFGIIPGIIVSSVLYALYHIGYGMSMDEMLFLMIIGLVYSTIFRLTSNIFILYPLLTPMGAVFSQLKEGLKLPFPATYGFADVIALMVIGILFIHKAELKSRTSTDTEGSQKIKTADLQRRSATLGKRST